LLVLTILAVFPPRVDGQGLFQVTLQAVDSQRHPIEREVRFLISGWGEVSVAAGDHGTTRGLSINGGNYHVEAYVLDVKVGETDVQIMSDITVTIQTRTYSLSVSVTGLPENMTDIDGTAKAQIGIETITSRFSQNQAVFGQIPGGSVSLTVFVGDKPVAAKTVFLSADSEAVLEYAEFKQVTVTVVDRSGAALDGATVTIGGVSGTTDAAGEVSLYSGSSEGIVVFRGIVVFNGTISEAESTVTAQVADLRVSIVDVASQPLVSTPLQIELEGLGGRGKWSGTVATDAQGNLTVSQLPYGMLTVSIPNGASVSTQFPLPATTKSLLLVTGKPQVDIQVVDAYMMGFMTVRVTVTIGKYLVKNATVSVNGMSATTEQGAAVVRVPLGLEWSSTANVTVRAFGMKTSKLVTVSASPLLVATSPLAFVPLVVWRLMVIRYKRRRPPLIESGARGKR